MTESELQKLLDELTEEGESEFVEFKQSLPPEKILFDEIGKYFSALSNGACLRNKDFGFLIFGITNKTHEIKGVDATLLDNSEKSLALHFRAHIRPELVKFEIHKIPHGNKSLILIKFWAAKHTPTTYNNKPWGRVDSHLVDLSHSKYADLLKRIYNSGTDWSKELVKGATIDDLDPEALAKAKEKFKERHETTAFAQEINSWTTKIFLQKSGVMTGDKLTNAALLLLGKKESRHLLGNSFGSAEILWKLDTQEEQSYEHFYQPFLTTTTKVWQRIRNTKYKLFPAHELLAREVNKYDEEVILEALHNCIAHQDYFQNSRIIVTEKADRLIFKNAGSFFEGKAEDYAIEDKTPQNYRNDFLVDAMIKFGMIDKVGLGIRKMFKAQKKKCFPMPDYNKSDNENVVLEIYGRILDEKFSQILMERVDLDFQTTIALDHVQKKQFEKISDKEVQSLKKQRLIEGRKPNYFISAKVADAIDQKANYIKMRGFHDEDNKARILEYLTNFEKASRKDFDDLLLKRVSDALSEKQKKDKIKNLLAKMVREGSIKNIGLRQKPIYKLAIN